MNEQDQIQAILSGERTAFRDLVEEHKSKVINVCYGFLKNEYDAEDTAQEVFIEVHRSIRNFKGNSKLSTWIYRIAVTKSLDALRLKNRKKRFGTVKQLLHIDDDDVKVVISGDEANIPDNLLESKFRQETLNKALEKLPESQKIAITLCSLENFSYSEIAELTGNSVNAVEALVFRARKNLKKFLKTYYIREMKNNG